MRIIINNKSDLGETKSLELVNAVILLGRIGNDGKQYCYATTFAVDGKGYAVYTDLRKNSDSFTIVNDKYAYAYSTLP